MAALEAEVRKAATGQATGAEAMARRRGVEGARRRQERRRAEALAAKRGWTSVGEALLPRRLEEAGQEYPAHDNGVKMGLGSERPRKELSRCPVRSSGLASCARGWWPPVVPTRRPPRPAPTGPSGFAPTKMPAIDKPVLFDTPEADAILVGPGGLPAGQPVEPRRRGLAAAPELEGDRRLGRGGQAAAVQPRHGLRPRAAGPEEGRR